jgi:hypothetical protein
MDCHALFRYDDDMADRFTDEQLEDKLMEALESWPLYRELTYQGSGSITFVPQYLNLFCDNCDHVTIWETHVYRGDAHNLPENNKRGFGHKEYRCRNCGRGLVRYWFYWIENKDAIGAFLKVGQHPPLDERIPGGLRKLLDGEDLGLYKTAIRLRNFNLGLGAVAYLRRVVENRMNDLLDVLHESARDHGAGAELLEKVDAIKAAQRFADKIDYAACLLPDSLHPKGLPNPIGVLHELTSEGLHSRPEDECIDIFDRCRDIFEHVFTSLRPKVEEQKAYVKKLSELVKRRPPEAAGTAKP